MINWIKENNNQVDAIKKLKRSDKRTAIINLNSKLLKCMASLYSDSDKETDSETNEQPDTTNEQPDTTNMPDLEIEEFSEQRRNQEGQGLKILTRSNA